MYNYIILASDEKGNFEIGLEKGEGKEGVLRQAAKRWKHIFIAIKSIKISGNQRDRTKAGELAAFFERLHMMIKAGIPVCRALEIMSITPGAPSKYAKLLYGGVSRGNTITDCMKKYSDKFPKMALKLINSGENSGNIELSCKKLSQYYNKIEQIKKELVNLSLYPIIVLIFSVITFISMQLIILPRFSELIYSNGIEIRGWSKIILDGSVYVRNNLFRLAMLILSVAVGGGVFLKRHIKHTSIEKTILKLPCIRRIYTNMVAMVFSQVMGMTMSSGMNILECMNSCKDIFKGKEYCKGLEIIEKNIIIGERFSKGMAKSGIFPEELVSIVSIGENSGDISEIFENMSLYYEGVLQITIKRMVSIAGPLIIILISVVIGAMLYLVIMPIMGTLNGLV